MVTAASEFFLLFCSSFCLLCFLISTVEYLLMKFMNLAGRRMLVVFLFLIFYLIFILLYCYLYYYYFLLIF